MKSIRTAVIVIALMQMFGLVAGVNSLALFSIWSVTWIGSFVVSVLEKQWDIYIREIIEEERR